MPSFVWERLPEEAYEEPYEYGAQEQFSREAARVLTALRDAHSEQNLRFSVDDKTVEKAVWMLQVDSLEALNDALLMIDQKKHRIASRLFRDAVETADISAYFFLGGEAAYTDLKKWYANEVIPHSRYRKFLKSGGGDKAVDGLAVLYSDLSKYTHRTYRAILKSYLRGRGDLMGYDGFRGGEDLVLPHTIAFCYALLGKLIKRFVSIVVLTGQLSNDRVAEIWSSSLEAETVPRRFGVGPGQLRRGPPMEIEFDDKE